MEQLILHLFGDYITQSDWMANNKTKSSFAALLHVAAYSLPFLLLSPSLAAFAVIAGTHFLIDRFRLARYLVFAKNIVLSPKFVTTYAFAGLQSDWADSKATGYPSITPPFLAVWLMILADNALHLAINYLALRFL